MRRSERSVSRKIVRTGHFAAFDPDMRFGRHAAKIIRTDLDEATPMAEPFNTLEAARKLQDAGCDPKLAEELASQINGAISGNVATKSDIERLEASTKSDIELVRKDIERLATREEVKDLMIEIQKLMNTQLKWIIGMFVAGFGLLFAALKFFG